MNCKEIRELLKIHPMDRTDQEEQVVRDHISECEECAREQASYGELDRMLQNAYRSDEAVLADERSDLDLGVNDDPVGLAQKTGKTWLYALAAFFMVGCVILGYFLGTLSSENRHLNQELGQVRSENTALKKKVLQTEQALAQARSSVRAPRTVVYQLFQRKEKDRPSVKEAEYRLPGFPMSRKIFKENTHDLY